MNIEIFSNLFLTLFILSNSLVKKYFTKNKETVENKLLP